MADPRSALIVGGPEGFSRLLAQKLLEKGWNVALSGDDEEEGEALAASLEPFGEAEFIPAHAGDEGEVVAMMDEVEALFDSLDFLLFAGFLPLADPLGKTYGQRLEEAVEDNLAAPYLVARYAKRLLGTTGRLLFLHPPFPEGAALSGIVNGGLERMADGFAREWVGEVAVRRMVNAVSGPEEARELLAEILRYAEGE